MGGGDRGHTKKPQRLQSLGVGTNRRCSPEGQKEFRIAEGMYLPSPTSQKLGCRTLWRQETIYRKKHLNKKMPRFVVPQRRICNLKLHLARPMPGNVPTCTWEVLVVVGVALCSGHPGLWIITGKHPSTAVNHTDGQRAGCVKTEGLTCPVGCLTRDNFQTQSSLDYSWTVDPASERTKKKNSPESERLELGN